MQAHPRTLMSTESPVDSHSQSPPTTINSLPPELLQEIFNQYVQEDGWQNAIRRRADSRPFYSQPQVRSLKVSSVCRLWRDIAATQPERWQGLVLDSLPLDSTQQAFPPREDVEELRSRAVKSKDRQFNLIIRYDGDIPSKFRQSNGQVQLNEENLVALIDIVGRYLAHRLRHLEVSMPVEGMMPFMSTFYTQDFPLLQVLKLTCLREHPLNPILYMEISNIPDLQNLTLCGPYFQFVENNNTEIIMRSLDLLECGSCEVLLASLQRLQTIYVPAELFIQFKESEFMSVEEMELVPLLNTERLILIDKSSDLEIGYFLKNVQLLGLRELHIEAARQEPVEDQYDRPENAREYFPELWQFIQRCEPPLQKLTVFGTSMTFRDFYNTLGFLTWLDELAGDDDLMTPQILHALKMWPPEVVRNNGTTMCMHMRTLTLIGCSTVSLQELVDLILSRHGDGPVNRFHGLPLATVRLFACSKELKRLPYEEPIRQLVESGQLHLDIA